MRKALLIIAILLTALPALGGTLSDFKQYVTESKAEADRLAGLIRDKAASDEGLNTALDALRDRLAKPGEKLRRVEFAGSDIEIDNRWIVEKMDIVRESPDKRLDGLTEISERLAAALLKIDELERAVAGGRTKDEDKAKLAEILSRVEYQKPEAPKEGLLDRILARIDEWLSEKFPRMDLPAGQSEGMRSTSVALQIVLYAVVIAAVGYLFFKFSPFLVSKLRWRRREPAEERVILGERIGSGESALTLFGEAEALARDGNLRGAVRKGYIALLCELSDRKIVGLARHKTNRDYLRDVRKHRALFQNMSGVTSSFERHWYGFEETTAEDWDRFRDGYRETMEASKKA